MNDHPPKLANDLSIIIVSFNTRDVLRECLQSVRRECAKLRTEVFVVDNSSSDGSPEMVESEFPEVRLLRSGGNLGFGPANNLALREAQGRYIVLLNSDAFLRGGALKLAIDHMDCQPEAGLGGCRLVGSDFSWQPSARMFPTVFNDALVLTGLAARFPKSRIFGRFDRTWADPALPAEVDWVPGAFSIIRPEALAKAGIFDPNFFLYSEEVDLCRRIKTAGYQIWYWPDIVVTHLGGESSQRIDDLATTGPGTRITQWRMRSTLLYYRKHHGSAALRAKWLELSLYRLSALRNRWSRNPQRRRRTEQNRKLVVCMQQAWKDTNGGRISPPRPW